MKAVKDELKSLQQLNPKFGELSAQLFSSTKRIGLEEADQRVCDWLNLSGGLDVQ
jgi:GTP-binding protein